ncbi:hypothetical protein XENORESO_018636 [Xenotaenia resolanae]|uniref:MHC class I antigen n=1 Tax=Xenotaenia resolanae TaxID=208358 RepID=A0ABV0X5M4_9TELE
MPQFHTQDVWFQATTTTQVQNAMGEKNTRQQPWSDYGVDAVTPGASKIHSFSDLGMAGWRWMDGRRHCWMEEGAAGCREGLLAEMMRDCQTDRGRDGWMDV